MLCVVAVSAGGLRNVLFPNVIFSVWILLLFLCAEVNGVSLSVWLHCKSSKMRSVYVPASVSNALGHCSSTTAGSNMDVGQPTAP